jgi:hypothetical protein
MTNSISAEPYGKVSGKTGASGGIFLPCPSPRDVIKSVHTPQHASASPEGHVEPSGKTGSHGGPQPWHLLPPMDRHDRAQSTGAREPRPDLT